MMFEKNAMIAVAVSGGPDSMALLHLLRSITKNITALTIDHGLRAESVAEASAVAAWCKKQKIEHHILKWRGKKPESKLHETARIARYELLQEFCRKHHILHLALAHHADDQAETVLQRIAKASGPQGLAAMQIHGFLPHLHLWRPLLTHPKSELVAYCEQYKIPFARDPSNENPKYARSRLRGAKGALSAEGMTTQNLNLFAQKQRAAAQALLDQAAQFLALHADLYPGERAVISHDKFHLLPQATAQFVMDYVLKLISGADAPIRHESFANLYAAISGTEFRAKTLGKCRIQMKKIRRNPYLLVTPEAA